MASPEGRWGRVGITDVTGRGSKAALRTIHRGFSTTRLKLRALALGSRVLWGDEPKPVSVTLEAQGLVEHVSPLRL